MWFLSLCIFGRLFWRARETLVKQPPVARSFNVFFDLRLNKWLSKQSWGCWFETPLVSLWLQCNVFDSKQPILVYSDWYIALVQGAWGWHACHPHAPWTNAIYGGVPHGALLGLSLFVVHVAICWDNQEPWTTISHIDRLVLERCNSSALAMELRLPCTNPLIYADNCEFSAKFSSINGID